MPDDSLIYVDDSSPGISRRKAGRGYAYYLPDGTHISDRKQVQRLNGLAVPPAYKECWFCPLPNGHLQATGYDDRKRKQYRYHASYREQMERRKFDLCAPFGEALPALRKQVTADLERAKTDKRRTLAALVRLLDTGLLRIGNDRYMKKNKTFGATTLHERHVELDEETLLLEYKAKSGKQRSIELNDANLAKFVRKLHDLPGQRLFQYFGADGKRHPVTSSDVNEYIKAYAGDGFSAKHFRTFGASSMAFGLLADAKEPVTIKSMTEPVAEKLGNTAATTRKSYIHPALFDFCNTELETLEKHIILPRSTKTMSREERGLIAFLNSL